MTSKKARILTIATPGGFERLFTDLGVLALPGTHAPPRPDDATLASAVAELGVQIIGPPPTESTLSDVLSAIGADVRDSPSAVPRAETPTASKLARC